MKQIIKCEYCEKGEVELPFKKLVFFDLMNDLISPKIFRCSTCNGVYRIRDIFRINKSVFDKMIIDQKRQDELIMELDKKISKHINHI